MDLVLIDSPVANVANIERALVTVGATVTLTADPDRIATASKIVLPGVGSFAAAMRWIGLGRRRRCGSFRRPRPARGYSAFASVIRCCSTIPTKTVTGADWDCCREACDVSPARCRFRRSGGTEWRRREMFTGLFGGIPTGTPFYFVNSYRVSDASSEIASSEYGGRFTAAAASKRIAGLQFHPEKSSTAGLRVLRNFVEIS